jgi:hypothetical protein
MALDQELTPDPLPVGAKGHADGQLVAAGVGPNQQQVRDVGAGHQQHEGYRHHQNPERPPDIANDVLLERQQRGLVPGLELGVGPSSLDQPDPKDAGRIGVGLREGHTRLEPSHAQQPEPRDQLSPIDGEREDDVELIVETKCRGHHADDAVRSPVDGERPFEDGTVAAEAALPVPVGQHHGRGRAWSIVGFGEPAANRGRHTERRQHTAARRQGANFLRLSHAGDGCRDAGAPDAHVLKRHAVVGVGRVDGVVEVRLILASDRVHDADERSSVGIRQRVDEHPVHNAEDGRRRANPKSERDDGGSGEAGLIPRYSGRVAKVLPKSVPESHGCRRYRTQPISASYARATRPWSFLLG